MHAEQVAELEAEVGDLQREVELRQEQETALKEVPSALPPLSVFLLVMASLQGNNAWYASACMSWHRHVRQVYSG